ncbi:unnamed protein product [Trichobilharzia regenti]|nr:unnamed protein product [Trichobilharzia regenti]
MNTDYNVRLHSHEVQYGTGSGQQSVTAVSDDLDTNSLWQVVERNGSPQCSRGRVIKCGQKIRLMHLSTRRNLHSHHFDSPLSANFEVSAFGNDGVGDEGRFTNSTFLCLDIHVSYLSFSVQVLFM